MTAAASIGSGGRTWQVWRAPLIWLGLAAGLVVAVFVRDFRDLFGIWWNSSTFNHCLLMLPMIGWLVHQRIGALRPLSPVAWWPGLLPLGGAALLWVVGDAGGIAVLRHLAIIAMLIAAVIALLGPQIARALTFPLAYSLLLVPFGEELVPLLQTLTARLGMAMLGLVGIEAHIEGVFITTRAGLFEVAEACSGINFLIAMLAYAVFAAHLCFRSWRRRILFVAGALAATIIANAIRAFATIAAAQRWGAEAAGGFDHIFYGWVFFGLVILIVMLIARRWFDRPADDMAVDVSRLQRPTRGLVAYPVAAAVIAALLGGSFAWASIVAARSAPLPADFALSPPTGWTPAEAAAIPWEPRFDGADRRILRHFTDPRGRRVDVAIGGYERQAEGREVVGFGQGAIDPDSGWSWSAALPPVAGGRTEQMLHPGPVLRDAATWYLVGGRLTGDPRRAKLQGLAAKLFGGDPRALSLVVSSEAGAGGRDAIAAFVAAAGGPQSLADRAIAR